MRVPLLKAETVKRGKMGQSLLFRVASGPRCWCGVWLLNIQLLRGWSKSMTGIGSNSWASCGSNLIRREWIDLSRFTLLIGDACKLSIRVRISSNWSSCCCCWIQCCGGLLNVPAVTLVGLLPAWLEFQFWKSVLKPLPDETSVTDSGRKASGSLNKSAMADWSGWLDEVNSTDWISGSNAFPLFIISGAWTSQRAWAWERAIEDLVWPPYSFFICLFLLYLSVITTRLLPQDQCFGSCETYKVNRQIQQLDSNEIRFLF